MLKEKEELGRAILEAILMNGYSKADAARKFGVKPPSITGWVQTGRISKGNFDELRKWLSKTPASHWGLDDQDQSIAKDFKELSTQEIRFLDAYRNQPSEAVRNLALQTLTLGVNAQSDGKGHTPARKKRKAA